MSYLRILLISAFLFSSLAGQEGKPRSYPQKLARGLWVSITSPDLKMHWALTGAGILLALPMDRQVKRIAIENGLMPEPLARFGYEWGGKWAAFGILPGIFIAETIRQSPRSQKYRRLDLAFSSLAVVGVTTEIIKYTLRRPRPNNEVLGFPYGHAFPSGHASAAFGVAEVVRTLYGNTAGGFCYGLAAITGLSRIHDNRHWLSDVIGGAGLGIGLVRGFYLAQKPDRTLKISQVMMRPGMMQITLTFSY